MFARTNDGALPADTARAMERVLQAEREAETRLAHAQREAQATVEAARQQALARVNRAVQRISRWQHGHARALDLRLAALQAQADAATQARPAPDAQQIAAAVAHVAARITGAQDGPA